MKINTKFKSSVFSSLFSNPDVLRELYCALEGVAIPADVPITINTLNDVLFMDRINDISFIVGGKLVVLIEHQSTVNPNMALRLFLYIARVYEKIISDRKIYSSIKNPLPRSEFYVLYNGKDPYPDNEGKNEPVIKRSKKLSEYSTFIAKVRAFEEELKSREEGVKAAIKFCLTHDILKEFLEKHGSEIHNM